MKTPNSTNKRTKITFEEGNGGRWIGYFDGHRVLTTTHKLYIRAVLYELEKICPDVWPPGERSEAQEAKIKEAIAESLVGRLKEPEPPLEHPGATFYDN
jgi:hypothetical protein